MPEIIVGLPLDRTLPPSVLPCWLSKVVQVMNVCAAGIYWAATELCCDMQDVRRKRWRTKAASVIWPPVYVQPLWGEILMPALTEWLSYWLTFCPAEWLREWTVLTACLAPLPSLSRGRSWNTPGINPDCIFIHSEMHWCCCQVLSWFSEHRDAKLEYHVY